MVELTPDQMSFLVQCLSSATVEIAKTGISRLSAALRHQPQQDSSDQLRDRMVQIQATLTEAGMSASLAEKIGRFIVHTGAISHLTYLAYISQVEEGSFVEYSSSEIHSYKEAFQVEVRAQLALELQISGEDLRTATKLLSNILLANAATKTRGGVQRSPDRPPARFLFSETETRSSIIASLSTPSLAEYYSFSPHYVRAIALSADHIPLQHLGSEAATVPFNDLYVEPSLNILQYPHVEVQRRTGDDPVMADELSIVELMEASSRTVVLGPAGVGKSTLVKHIVKVVTDRNSETTLHLPLVIELRKFQARSDDDALFVNYVEHEISHLMQRQPPAGWVEYMLLTGRATVLFDGYDEVLDSVDRLKIRDAIQNFARLYPAAGIVITSRIIGYDSIPFPDQEFMHAAINDFDVEQVAEYASNWFGMRPEDRFETRIARVHSFLAETEKHARDLRANPLMLTLLCSVYYQQGDIPRTLAELYQRCAALMFQQWSTMRGLDDLGVWANEVRPALYRVAHLILNDPELRRDGIRKDRLLRELSEYFLRQSTLDHESARIRADLLVSAWAGRAWIITEIGRDPRNIPLFGFVHQSFLEYFAAMQIVRESRTQVELFEHLQEPITLLNGWPMAQIAVAVWNDWREEGASEFVECALGGGPHNTPREMLHLLNFCESLRGFVPLTSDVDRLLVSACLRLYVESLPTPQPGENLAGLHARERSGAMGFEHEDIVKGLGGELAEYAEAFGMEEAMRLPITTLHAELVLNHVSNFGAQSQAHLQLLLATLDGMPEWETMPNRMFVAFCFLAVLMEPEKLEFAGEDGARWIEKGLEDAYHRVREDGSWLAHAAAFASGIIDAGDALSHIPWNSAISQDSIVLSFLVDFDLPCIVKGDAVADFLFDSGARNDELSKIGASFLADISRGKGEFDPIPTVDACAMIDLRASYVRPSAARMIDDSGWSSDVMAGLFVVLAVCVELDINFRPETLVSRNDPHRVRDFLLWCFSGRYAISDVDLSDDPAVEPLQRVVHEWRSHRLRLTDRR